MGKCYLKGHGVATDKGKAKTYLTIAKEYGDYNAEWFLERYFSK